jgi:uncharacterized protein DUF6600
MRVFLVFLRRGAIACAAALTLLIVFPIAFGPSATAVLAQGVSVSSEFRVALEPYGKFRRHSRWGEVWVPAHVARDWRPYTVGNWVYTNDYGWYWNAADESGAGSSITMAVGYGTTISAGCGCRALSGAPDGSIGGAAVGILVGRHYRRMRSSSKSETCHGTGCSSSHGTSLNRGLRHS